MSGSVSSIPFDAAIVIKRLDDLRQADQLGLQQIRGAADYAAITGLRDFRPPESFVVTLSEAGAKGASASPGRTRQVAAVQFSVVTAVRNLRYQRGEPALKDAGPLLGQIRDCLIGWIPPLRGARGCQWERGSLVDYDAGTLLWADIFSTQHFIGTQP